MKGALDLGSTCAIVLYASIAMRLSGDNVRTGKAKKSLI